MLAARQRPYLPTTPSSPIPPRNLKVRTPASCVASTISGA